MIKKLLFILAFLAIVGFVAVFGYQIGAWSGFPKGVDAYSRITRIVYLLDFFPDISWQYHWANGMPNFKSEAPLFYVSGAFLAKVFSLSPEKPLIILGFLTFVLLGLGALGFVATLSGSLAAGLLSAVLILSSFSFWSWMVHGGIYPRILGVGLMSITLWRAAVFLKKLRRSDSFPQGAFLLAVVSLAVTILTHALMGFFTCLAIAVLFLFYPLTFKNKIKYGLGLALSAFGLSGFFLLPALLNFGTGSGRFLGVISEVIPAPLEFLYNFSGIGPLILPLLGLSLLLLPMAARFKKKGEVGLGSLFWSPFLMFVLFSVYALIGYLGVSGKYYYINGFIPTSATLFMALFGSLMIGLVFGFLTRGAPKLLSPLVLVVVAVIGLFSVFYSIQPILNGDLIKVTDTGVEEPGNDIRSLQKILKFPEQTDFDHRFAPFEAFEAVWFNVFYQIPQVRDYYGQGILYPDWRYWFEQAIWNTEEFSMDEAWSAFDWYAVRWFSVQESHDDIYNYEVYGPDYSGARSVEQFLKESSNRYLREPGIELATYGRWGASNIQEQFEIENPSPILSATNAPTILFIGKEEDYNLLFSNLTFGNYSSQKVIPVRGEKRLDNYRFEELKKFDILLLYAYEYKNLQKAGSLLTEYLNQGGKIIWEAWESPAAWGKVKNQPLPEPFPFSYLKEVQIETGDWDFVVGQGELVKGIDFKKFSPPVYEGQPWKLMTGSADSLRPWAKVLLASGENPLVVEGEFGQGKIVWTGFNFLYHLNANKNLEEAKFFYQVIDGLVGPDSQKTPVFQTQFINPQKREIVIEDQAKGVLFKESYYPQWGAFSKDAKGKKQDLKINLAGPGVSYLPLAEKTEFPVEVVIEYRFSWLERIGFLVSLLTVFGIIASFLGLKFLKKSPGQVISKQVSKKAKSWWDDEEG